MSRLKFNPLFTNVSNYLGAYNKEKSYKKFDFVYDYNLGKFFYAKEDIAYLPEYTLQENQRFILDPSGPIWGGYKTFYLYDLRNDVKYLTAGQKIIIENSSADNNGSFLLIENQKDYSQIDRPDTYNHTESLLQKKHSSAQCLVSLL